MSKSLRQMVLSSFLALYLCLKSLCNILGQSHPKLIIFGPKSHPACDHKFPRFSIYENMHCNLMHINSWMTKSQTTIDLNIQSRPIASEDRN